MDLPPDFPPVHSCNLCNKLILDPRGGGLFDRKNTRREWAAFNPELTVRDLREQQRHGCAFGEHARIGDEDDDAPVLYSFNSSEGGIPGFQSVEFGIPGRLDSDTESGSERTEHDSDEIGVEPDGIEVYRWWTRDLLAIPGSPACDVISRTPINVEPGSDKSFELARKWYQTCRDTHKECQRPQLKFMPERVIRIDYRQSKFLLRLHETQGLAIKPYCALSYCWGGDQELKTTSDTLHTFRTAIPFRELPATIRDAITTTYELGLRYLFVDSLCIIQDSQDDMHTQIAQMSDIFSEAAITILASRAHSVETGFLHERPSPLENYSKGAWRYKGVSEMRMQCPTGEIGSVILMGSEHIRPGNLLRTRAWVLQEELLAHRTLDFDHNQTVWTCRSTRRLVDGWLDNYGWNQDHLRWLPELSRPRILPKAGENTGNLEDRKEILALWHRLVVDYSGRDLTEPNDKLLAIGAIARRVGDALQDDDYLAGIWKSSIPRDLFWHVPSNTKYPRPEDFRAPSWSWAAIDGAVHPAQTSGTCSLDVIDCHTEPVFPGARFGAVTTGHLVVRGRLRQVFLLDLGYEGTDYCGLFRVKEPSGHEFWAPLCFDALEQEFSDHLQQPLEIAMLEVYGVGEVTRSGLVLQEVGSRKFSRLGLFSWQFDPSDPDEDSDISRINGYVLYSEWIKGFDQCDKVEITLI
ncbi:hypothetical protein PV04_04014 [Phialophora macrospora]|uniref:Heterokaryon incompatibility domain-containing protein n=1 Tax=Phialophora macrospora TaxID=1851006 RepID=A0A0D2G834_9EURO|nr:hypothetical protein PV04_04014 [Phialophora macrospora]